MWEALLEQMRDRPVMGWLSYFQLDRLEGERVMLRTRPGHREAGKFLTEARLEQIRRALEPWLGPRLRVELETEPASQAPQEEGSQASQRSDAPPSRAEARDLPLVRRVLEYFPDATVLDTRRVESPDQEAE